MKKENGEMVTKWLPIFVIGVLLIVLFKVIDNLDILGNIIGNFFRIISPFLFGILICYFTYKPSLKMEKAFSDLKVEFFAKRARLFGVLSVYLMVLLLMVLFVMFIAPILVNSIVDLAGNMQDYYNNVVAWIANLSYSTGLDLTANVNDFANTALSQLLEPARVEAFARGMFGLANSILNFFIALIVSLYILIERETIYNFFDKLGKVMFKETTNNHIKKYLSQINTVLFTFIAGKGLDSIINWVVVTTILLILGVEYAVLLGIIAGIANFIPYLGSLIAVIFISFLTLLTGGLELALPTFILLIIFQQIDGNYIEPRIMKTVLKLSPILVIFAVIVGGAYFGIIGMFLGVPFVAICKQILLEYMEIHKKPIEKT